MIVVKELSFLFLCEWLPAYTCCNFQFVAYFPLFLSYDNIIVDPKLKVIHSVNISGC